MKPSLNLPIAMLAVLALPGCLALEDDDPEIGSNTAELWTVGDTVSTVEWDSGSTNNLSAWQSITCTTTYT